MHGPTPTSEAREIDVTGSHLLIQTTFRDTPRGSGPSRTSPSVSATVGGRTQYNYPNANYSPMIGLRWEYSPMVGIKIAAVLGGFFLLYAVYNTLKGVVKCWKQSTEDDEEDTSDEEEDGKQSEELEVVESTRLDWGELVSPKRGVDDGVRPELRPLPYPLSQYLGRLQCTVEIPDCEEDGNCERTDSRTCA